MLPNIPRFNTYPSQTLPKRLRQMECFQIHFMKPALPGYQNQTKIWQKKKITGQYSWWTSTDWKIFKKYLQTEFNNTVKRSCTMIKWDLFRGMQRLLIGKSMWYTMLAEGKKNHDHSKRCRKAFDKIQDPFMIKTQSWHRGNVPQHNKDHIWQVHS